MSRRSPRYAATAVAAHRRRRPRVPVLLVATAIAAGPSFASASQAPEPAPAPAVAIAQRGPVIPLPVVPEPAPAEDVAAPQVFAVIEGVELFEPADEVLAIGFHETRRRSDLELTPVGTLVADETHRHVPDVLPDSDAEVRVLASRGRAGGPTSAVDIALAHDAAVRSVVTGTVVGVHRYSLYGRIDDVLVQIAPDGHEHLQVVLMHLVDVQVSEGDRVVAGFTPIAAGARALPMGSQIDDHTGCACPHVHLQVERRQL